MPARWRSPQSPALDENLEIPLISICQQAGWLLHEAQGEESPGSMEARCRITSGEGDLRESATESKPPLVGCRVRQG